MLNQKTSYKTLIYSGVWLLILVLVGAASMQAKASQTANLIAEGKQIFRFDTFGDEDFWGVSFSYTRRSRESNSAV